jgi:hypothetical protein
MRAGSQVRSKSVCTAREYREDEAAIIVGLGIEPSFGRLEDRVNARIDASDIDPRLWPDTVIFGSASHMPQVATLNDLISEANAASCRVRNAVRLTATSPRLLHRPVLPKSRRARNG